MTTLLNRRSSCARSARIFTSMTALAGAGSLLLGPAAGVLTGPARAVATSATARVGALSSAPIVGMAPSGTDGYWLVSSVGGVFAFGTAAYHGSAAGLDLSAPIVGIAATPNGGGYWLVSANGGVLAFGDAGFYGSAGGLKLASPVVSIVSTPSGQGYWLITAAGGVFSYGDAAFHGSGVGYRLSAPIVSAASSPTGNGYWLVSSNGGILSFGDAAFHGSAGGLRLAAPVVGIATTSSGNGYWLASKSGGVFTYGTAAFSGAALSFDSQSGAQTIGIDAIGGGYWVPNNLGHVDSLGAPAAPEPNQIVYSPGAGGKALPAETMPATNIAPSAAFASACWSAPVNVSACNSAALADIDSALASEGYGPLSLPANFSSLSTAAQVLAVANAERQIRGLPVLPENSYLDSLAAAGASADGGAGADPTGPAGYGWGSNIAWGDPTALSADFSWMYDDGAGGENIDCETPSGPGCWGHRKNILADWGGEAGAGSYVDRGTLALTELFVENY